MKIIPYIVAGALAIFAYQNWLNRRHRSNPKRPLLGLPAWAMGPGAIEAPAKDRQYTAKESRRSHLVRKGG